MVPPSLAVGFGTVHASLASLSVEGKKKRQATVAIQAEPNLHVPGFLHPSFGKFLSQTRSYYSTLPPVLRPNSPLLPHIPARQNEHRLAQPTHSSLITSKQSQNISMSMKSQTD